MRVYIPGTSTSLGQLATSGIFGSAPLTAFAVTPGLREHYLDDDIEELEYAAFLQASRASLRLLDADPSAARRRIVIAADVSEEYLVVRDDLDRGVVRISAAVSISWCVSVHCDDGDAEAAVAEAVPLVDAADLGDPNAEDKVDDVDGFELCWYATQEIGELLAEIT